MKTVFSFIFLVTVLFANAAWACRPHPDLYTRVKNNLITAAANQVGISLMDAKIQLENYNHNMQWRFTDSGFQCHDTDITSGVLTLKGSNYANQNCSAKIQISQMKGPEVKNGPSVIKTEVVMLEELSCVK